jgi:hypothetical protein
VIKMDYQFLNDFELKGREKEKWERHMFIVKLFEDGVEIEEIAKLAGLSEEEVNELFPRLY